MALSSLSLVFYTRRKKALTKTSQCAFLQRATQGHIVFYRTAVIQKMPLKRAFVNTLYLMKRHDYA